MRAVLVGTVGDDRLYYILDAKFGEDDGALEREDGSLLMLDFMSFASTARGLNKIRSSSFHRRLWDSPKKISSGSWNETFIKKTKDVDEKLLESSPVYSSLGKNRKKVNKIIKKTENFKKSNSNKKILNKSAHNSVVKFEETEYVFTTSQKRRDAWVALCALREIEEKHNGR